LELLTIIASSTSSETMTLHFPLALKALTMISLLSTSNFFWSSPWTFAAPANPTRLISRALRTLDAMYLDVTWYQPCFSQQREKKKRTHLDGNEKHGEITSSSLTKSTLLSKQVPRQGDQVGCWGFQLGRRVWVWHFCLKVFDLEQKKGEKYGTAVSVSIFWVILRADNWSADINQRITDWSKTSLGVIWRHIL